MKSVLILTFIVGLSYFVHGRPNEFKENKAQICGYKSCPVPKKDMINVHIVPHTHDDVGWLKTVDQYYYGSENHIQKAGVQYIIDSVIQELLNDPKKKFIYVESAFFFQWWKEQTVELQEGVKNLVNEGRLEFIGGAWSMNDEATAHYQSIIDQFGLGLKHLNDTFGECGRPKIAWQIDPFGHSREQASIFAQMGYDGLFFGRLDEDDKLQRLTTKKMEMIWKANEDLGESSDLFTGALYNQYQPPPGFCFDILCADEPIIDDKNSSEYNVDRRLKDFKQYIEVMADSYRTNNVLITMGEDFHYQDAHMWYKNLDKLIKYGNEKQISNNSNLNLFYSTPSCYLKALHDSQITWPLKTDDFFPYGSDKHSYWTGYFTSRPTLKRYERIANHFLQVSKQLSVLNPIKLENQKEIDSNLEYLRETMGIMQHHDAVTGTEKQKVADDYAKRIDIGLTKSAENTKIFLQNLVQPSNENYEKLLRVQFNDNHLNKSVKYNMYPNVEKKKSESLNYKFEFKNCLLLNISQCEITETSERFIITIYNPLSYSTDEYIRVPVPSSSYKVQDYREVEVPHDIVKIPQQIESLKFRKSEVQYELVFLAEQVPPIGYKSYYITRIAQGRPPLQPTPKAGSFSIKNKYLQLDFGKNGRLSRVISNGVNISLEQDFLYYKGFYGNNTHARYRASGAYIFRPNGTEAVKLTDNVKTEIIQGSLVQEVHQTYNDYISQVIRLYAEENHVEFEWLVQSIPIQDGIGKEIITRFNSDIKSNGVFYTDSSGRQMIRRKRDHRDTWNYEVTEPISGNYYPLLTNIALEDDYSRMAILVDRAQGGSSIFDGSLEIMIHRRLLRDDAFGVGEALNETAYNKGLVSRGKHYLVVGRSKLQRTPSTKAQERFLQIQKHLPVWTFFDNANELTFEDFRSKYYVIFVGLSLSLPKNIHILTMEPWHDNEVLIRFEHIMQKDEDVLYSKPTTFNLKDVFRYFDFVDIQETTLDGNMWLKDKNRLRFTEDLTFSDLNKKDNIEVILKHKRNVDENHKPIQNIVEIEKLGKKTNVLPPADKDPFEITINPQEIRTFIITREQKI